MTSLEGYHHHSPETTAQMVAEGSIGLEEASRFLTAVTNTANLVGYQRIGEVREMIEAFER